MPGRYYPVGFLPRHTDRRGLFWQVLIGRRLIDRVLAELVRFAHWALRVSERPLLDVPIAEACVAPDRARLQGRSDGCLGAVGISAFFEARSLVCRGGTCFGLCIVPTIQPGSAVSRFWLRRGVAPGVRCPPIKDCIEAPGSKASWGDRHRPDHPVMW